MSNQPKKSLGMPLEMAKQSLRDNPDTKKIADSLGVELEEYIDQVMHYAMNPELEPELEVYTEEQLEEAGVEGIPSPKECQDWFEAAINGEINLSGRIDVEEKDGFSTKRDQKEVIQESAGVKLNRRAPRIDQLKAPSMADGAGSALKNQLLQQQQAQRIGMDARRSGRPAPGPDKNKK